MKVLIVGYGSIGKRHFEVLNSLESILSIDIVTKQNIEGIKSFKQLRDIENLDIYDYFIIASETVKHYEQLKYICEKVKDKKILVEKPLYEKKYDEIDSGNKIFTAYNLRFHPILQKLKELVKNDKIYYANIICGQYLPSWRPEQDYRNSYSADIDRGGGVLRDLSHELDYITWLFGDIQKLNAINSKISDLEINSDDIFIAIAVSNRKIIINVSMDYISKIPIRRVIVHTQESTIEADMIKNSMVISDKNSNIKNIKCKSVDRNYTYSKMHEAIINNSYENVCSFNEGSKILDVFQKIQYEEI